MTKNVVIIPIHKSSLNKFEIKSLERAKEIFLDYKLIIICPKSIDCSNFLGIETNPIGDFWFKNLNRYNKLKKSKFFYRKFSSYEFVLTYELDAFVFRDELQMWCSKGYDYIGAPWFEGFTEADSKSRIIGVGNSGFSLRKTTLKDKINEYIQPPKIYYSKKIFLKMIGVLIVYMFQVLRKIKLNNSVFLFNDDPEDIFFGYRLKEKGINMNIAPISEAIKFSFEINPEVLLKMNNNILPFGCHAWWKYDLEFWKNHIKI
jgi:hypothetical protein